MNKRLLVIATAVVFIAVAIALMTTRAQATRPPEGPKGRTVISNGVPDVVAPGFDFPSSWTEYRHMGATVNGQFVTIEGSALVHQIDTTIRYLWSTRIYEPGENGKLLKERHYTDQAIGGEVDMTPEFRDVVLLEPGRYRVELTLYGVRPGWDWSAVPRGKDLHLKAWLTMDRSQTVTIEE
jgi:hypothetical protein